MRAFINSQDGFLHVSHSGVSLVSSTSSSLNSDLCSPLKESNFNGINFVKDKLRKGLGKYFCLSLLNLCIFVVDMCD